MLYEVKVGLIYEYLRINKIYKMSICVFSKWIFYYISIYDCLAHRVYCKKLKWL